MRTMTARGTVGMTAKVLIAACGVAAIAILTTYLPGPLANRILAYRSLRDRFSEVDVSDGIQENEAHLIASEYASLVLGEWGGCSATSRPSLSDGMWKADILFGYGGERLGHQIGVDRMSGGASSPGESTYETFASLRRARLLNALLRGR